MDPTPERFRRLARSSPFRWRSLELEGTFGARDEWLRVHVGQPDHLRVSGRDGTLLFAGRQGSLGSTATLTSDGGRADVPTTPAPELDDDGLVRAVRRPWADGPELPMWRSYRFVAMLDPYELSQGVDVLELRPVEHGGRPAWEALLLPTSGYDPRCACCPLLRTRHTDLAEGLTPLPAYADAHRVRLDVGTGVCVSAVEVGGPADGQGHDITVAQALG